MTNRTVPENRNGLTLVEDGTQVGRRPPGDQHFWVVDAALGELLVARGVSSTHVHHGSQGSPGEWAEVIERDRNAPVPPRPHRPDVSCLVVLPTFNESENLYKMVEAIGHHLVADVLVVDDNSPDGTGEIADRLAAENDHVHVMHRAGKMGLGTAYVEGFSWGIDRGYERLIQMDCDFSHDPRDLPRLVHASKKADLVIGSRYVSGGSTEGWGFRRRLLSRCANLYTKLFLGRSVQDWTAGYRCFDAAMLRRVDLSRVTAAGFCFQIQMAFLVRRSGGRVREIPVHFVDRLYGESKLSGGIAAEAIRVVPMLRFRA